MSRCTWSGIIWKSSDRDGTAAAGASKIRLTVVIAVNLSLLAYFKYAAMIVKTINRLAGTSFAIPQIALPIGISFFTFQALSYVIDVYRGECERQKRRRTSSLKSSLKSS